MNMELTGEYDIFISYSTVYRSHVRRLYNKLCEHGYKCWLDDVEKNVIQSVDDYFELKPDRPKLEISELADAINNSKIFLCCISKEYCRARDEQTQTKNINILEINHARNIDKPMVILSMERLTIVELGGVGFIIGPLIRINAYKFKNEYFDEPTGNLMRQVITSIEVKLNPPIEREINSTNEQGFNVRTLNSESDAILCMKELTNNRLACGSSDWMITIWDLNNLNNSDKHFKKLEKHTDAVVCLKELPENRLVSGSLDSLIIIWSLASFQAITTLKGHKNEIICLKVLPNKQICSGSSDCTMRIWNTKTYECIREIIGPVKIHVKMFRDTKFYAKKFINENIFKPKIDSGNDQNILPKKTIEDEENPESIKEINSQIDLNKTVEESSNASILNTKDPILKLDGHTKLVYCLKTIKTPKEYMTGTLFASGSYDTLIKIWDVLSYECVSTLRGHKGRVICLKNLPCNRLASGSTDGTIRVWDLENFICIKTLTGHNSCVQSLALLSSNRLVSGSFDCTFRMWNLSNYKFECIKVFKDHIKPVNIVKKLSNDRLITSCNEHVIKVWNTKNNECIQTFRDHSSWISYIIVLKNGCVCSCSWDGFVKLWTPVSCI